MDIRSYFASTSPSRKKQKCDKENTRDVEKTLNYADMETWLEEGWRILLEGELVKPYFEQLKQFLLKEEEKYVLPSPSFSLQHACRKKVVYPLKSDVFAAFDSCPFDRIKVVILGQDPYHGPGQAHGLCFSVQRGVKVPPSLRNVFKEAAGDVGLVKPAHGTLTRWAQQGVFLLNTVLTVRQAEANSHKKQGWEPFTDAVIRLVSERGQNIVFLLWGRHAQEKATLVDGDRHCVVMSSHPSPLGATKSALPFMNSKCFSRANAYLEEHGREPIDWKV
jgi:uracil-DNA glycosylase